MQTALAYFAARRRQVITICALTLLLVMHHRVVAKRQYSRNTSNTCHHRLVWPAKTPCFLLQNTTLRMLSSKIS